MNSSIIGGKVDMGEPAVVAVLAYGPTSYSTCTGEIIAANVVLTAGHCVDPRTLGYAPLKVAVVTSTNATKPAEGEELLPRAVYPHPE